MLLVVALLTCSYWTMLTASYIALKAKSPKLVFLLNGFAGMMCNVVAMIYTLMYCLEEKSDLLRTLAIFLPIVVSLPLTYWAMLVAKLPKEKPASNREA